MDWLKDILKESLGEDVVSDDLITKINKEFPKHAVPKSVFNEKNKALELANTTIEELKASGSDGEKLKAQIEEYKAKVEKLDKQAKEKEKTYILKEELIKKGIKDPEYLIYKQGGIDKFEFSDDNKIKDIDKFLDTCKETYPYLFGDSSYTYKPNGGTGSVVVNPFAKETFNLTEQGRILKQDPARARELASAVGVEI